MRTVLSLITTGTAVAASSSLGESKPRNPILKHFHNEQLSRYERRRYQSKREYNQPENIETYNPNNQFYHLNEKAEARKLSRHEDSLVDANRNQIGAVREENSGKHEDKIVDARKLLYNEADKLESARLYGDIAYYAYYFADLLIGSPVAQRTSVIVDTGSSLCGYPCKGCSHCGKHIDDAFDITKSESAEWVKCNNQCTCKGDKCSYYQGYTEGSSINGFWFEDYARLGDTIQQNPAVKVIMGCHMSENKLFYTQKANGIFGLAGSGGKDLRLKPTILKAFLKDRKYVNSNVFSMCMAQKGGRLIAGGYNSTYHVDQSVPITWVPLEGDSKFYVVKLDGMKVNSVSVGSGSAAFGRTIVDSGTTYSYFPSTVYRTMKSTINSECAKMGSCGSKSGRECYSTSGVTLQNVDEKFPKMTLTIGGVEDVWYARSYMYQRSANKWCITFDDNGAHGGSVMGASWMIDHNVIFDLDNSKMGIANARCPWYQTRPRGPLPEDFLNQPAKPSAEKHDDENKQNEAPANIQPAVIPTNPPEAKATVPPVPATPTQPQNSAGAAMPPIGYTPGTNPSKPAQQQGDGKLAFTGWLPSFYDNQTADEGGFGGHLLFLALSLVSLVLIAYNCFVLFKTCKSRRNYLQAGNRENPDDGVAGDEWLRQNATQPYAQQALGKATAGSGYGQE